MLQPRIYLLDQHGQPAADLGYDYEFLTFSGGEPHVKFNPIVTLPRKLVVDARITSMDDLGHLMVLVDSLKEQSVLLDRLILPYFPGGRQDRRQAGAPFTARVYADIINGMGFGRVVVYDEHSYVTSALLHNCDSRLFKDLYIDRSRYGAIVAPDQGAQHRTQQIADACFFGVPVVQCLKERDPATGQLSGFRCVDDVSSLARVLIVDDICDGGRTFIGVADTLREQNPDMQIDLYVTHGIFSHGTEDLRKSFGTIYSTTSIHTEQELIRMGVVPFKYFTAEPSERVTT